MNTDTLHVYKTEDEIQAAVDSGEAHENRNLVYGNVHVLGNLACELKLHRDDLERRRKHKQERQNKKNGAVQRRHRG